MILTLMRRTNAGVIIQSVRKKEDNLKNYIPKRMARRTRRGSSRNVDFGGKGVAMYPFFRSWTPASHGHMWHNGN